MNQEKNFPVSFKQQVKQETLSVNSVTPLSKYLAMILFIIMPFLGGWIGYKYSPEKVVEVEKIVVHEVNSSNQNSDANLGASQSQELVYRNSKYGFSLTFPETWKGYTAKPRILDWGAAGISDSVDFGFATQDSVFNISIYTKSQWQQIMSDDGPRPTYLAENNWYIFGYAASQDSVDETIIVRRQEIADIVKTFNVYSDNSMR